MANVAKKQLEEKKKAAKRNRIILIVLLSVVVLAVVGALIATNLLNKDYKYARMNVTYTDKNGVVQTGDIVIELRADCAPITVANFQKLVSEGYYNGTDFFRIIDGVMIQGGENSEKKADYIKGEFAVNGVDNPLSHVRGTISMARRAVAYDGVSAYNSASSGFFIVQQDYPSWDGQYAAFGTVVSGMEHVDGIAGTELVESETYGDVVAPKYPATINSVTLSEKP